MIDYCDIRGRLTWNIAVISRSFGKVVGGENLGDGFSTAFGVAVAVTPN
jgi:hypothetical protein